MSHQQNSAFDRTDTQLMNTVNATHKRFRIQKVKSVNQPHAKRFERTRTLQQPRMHEQFNPSEINSQNDLNLLKIQSSSKKKESLRPRKINIASHLSNHDEPAINSAERSLNKDESSLQDLKTPTIQEKPKIQTPTFQANQAKAQRAYLQ
jgi:hypothetical protein